MGWDKKIGKLEEKKKMFISKDADRSMLVGEIKNKIVFDGNVRW